MQAGDQDDPHIHTTARLDIGSPCLGPAYLPKQTHKLPVEWIHTRGGTPLLSCHSQHCRSHAHSPTYSHPTGNIWGCARSHCPFAEIQVAAWELHTALESTGYLHSKEESQEMCWPHGTSRSGDLKGVQLPLSWWCPLLQLWLGPWHPTCCCHSAES